jgi:hypothetical protein
MSVDGASGNRRRLATLAAGTAVFIVALVTLAGLGSLGWPRAQEGEAPNTYSRVLNTYEKRVSGNPGLSYTETFATLRCDPGDQLLGGGFSGLDEGTVVIASEPDTVSSAEAWLVGWENDASPDAVNVAVLCAEAAFPPHE